MKKEKLINVFGCFKCQKLAGNLRLERMTTTRQGYEICPICSADLDNFWLNLEWMRFEQSRMVSVKRMNELADLCNPFLSEKPVQKSTRKSTNKVVAPKKLKSWWKKSK